METIYNIDGAQLNKCEIDILQFVDSWLPTFQTWSVQELSQKCGLFTDEASHAVDMLILHGLMVNVAKHNRDSMAVVLHADHRWLQNVEPVWSGIGPTRDA